MTEEQVTIEARDPAERSTRRLAWPSAKSASRTWLPVLLVLVVAGALAYWLWPKEGEVPGVSQVAKAVKGIQMPSMIGTADAAALTDIKERLAKVEGKLDRPVEVKVSVGGEQAAEPLIAAVNPEKPRTAKEAFNDSVTANNQAALITLGERMLEGSRLFDLAPDKGKLAKDLMGGLNNPDLLLAMNRNVHEQDVNTATVAEGAWEKAGLNETGVKALYNIQVGKDKRFKDPTEKAALAEFSYLAGNPLFVTKAAENEAKNLKKRLAAISRANKTTAGRVSSINSRLGGLSVGGAVNNRFIRIPQRNEKRFQ